MKTRSAKAKGKRLEKWVVEQLKAVFGFDDDDIRVPVGAETGADIKIAKKHALSFPFAFECKNQEAVGPIYKMYAQAESHCDDDTVPLLIIKKNNTIPLCVLDAREFFYILGQAKYGRRND